MHMWTVFTVQFDTVAISNKELHLHYVSSGSFATSPWTEAGQPTAGLWPWTTADLGGGRRWGRTSAERLGQRSSTGDLRSGPQCPRGRARRQVGSGGLSDGRPRRRVGSCSGARLRATSAASWPGGGAWRPHQRAMSWSDLDGRLCSTTRRWNVSRREALHFCTTSVLQGKLLHWFVCLLEEEIAMYSDFRKPFFRLRVLVRVSLS
jgi:hypothetical protein